MPTQGEASCWVMGVKQVLLANCGRGIFGGQWSTWTRALVFCLLLTTQLKAQRQEQLPCLSGKLVAVLATIKGSLSHCFTFPFHPTQSSFVHLESNQVFFPIWLRAEWVHISVASFPFQTCRALLSSPSPARFCCYCVGNHELKFFSAGFIRKEQSNLGRERLSTSAQRQQ